MLDTIEQALNDGGERTLAMAASVISRKDAATTFLRQCAAGQARQAFATYVGDGFRHHNAYFPGTPEALMNAIDANAREYPKKTFEILHAIEDGDLVAVHARVQMQPGDRGIAVVHLLRFNKDRIVEFWDIGQPVPENSPNANGMF